MNDNFFTRSQWQEYCLEQAAKKGDFFIHLKLFPNERKRLKKKGFSIRPINSKDLNRDVICIIHFVHAFKDGIPPIVHAHLLGVIQTPVEFENYAQELFIVAYKKAYLNK